MLRSAAPAVTVEDAMKGKQREMAMWQVRVNQPAITRWASFCAGLVAVSFSLLAATQVSAQPQGASGKAEPMAAPTAPPVNYPVDEFGSGRMPAPMTPAQAPNTKDGKVCCTPGKDCPCTPGKDCACTPGVNCPCVPGKNCACTPGLNCPARPPLRADFCTPGKNCPCQGDNCRHCTPGKDCSCTPFINCPNDFGVIFEKNAGEVSEDNKQKLARAVVELKKLPEGEMIRIEGHTAPSEANGNPPERLKLSQSRARAVEQALLQAGLPPNRIAPGGVRGWGGLCPQVLNPEDDKNRRVQFMFSQDVTLCAQTEGQRRGANLPPYKKAPQKGGAKTPQKAGAKPAQPAATGAKPAQPAATTTKPAQPAAGQKPAGTR